MDRLGDGKDAMQSVNMTTLIPVMTATNDT
jgi:hypothetical protein